ncbi:hypothetical protein PanWU01x14_298180 [Parasponia andersonii]|uniref:Uncharacterized protein n=1 Tax=Parasponia andersonii TaxID=3476 RepID=A0A2P5AV30_PARAD|nr:hypothetical protein PanWU01x14_298180 [Parasponia andersonii]
MYTFLTWRGCTSSWHCKGCGRVDDSDSSRLPTQASTIRVPAAAAASCKMVDGLVGWLRHGLAVAFFASLQRCSCVNIDTRDEIDDDADNYLMAAADSHDLCGDSTLEMEISTETRRKDVIQH